MKHYLVSIAKWFSSFKRKFKLLQYRNFDINQAEMKEQLCQIHCLLRVIEPELANYLERHESGNMYFCFRWVLIWFKREFNHDQLFTLWEALWTDWPCKNFHLLVSAAILDTEKDRIISNNYGFTEILKVRLNITKLIYIYILFFLKLFNHFIRFCSTLMN